MAKLKVNKKLLEKAVIAKSAIKNAVKPEKGEDKGKNSKVSSHKLELLITVVNRQKTEFYQDLLQEFEVNMQLSMRAKGTATKQTLHLLGLEDTPKSVIFSIIREDRLQDALAMLDSKFKTIKDGAGVAYTVPLTSVIGVAIFGFLSNNEKTVKEDKNEKV